LEALPRASVLTSQRAERGGSRLEGKRKVLGFVQTEGDTNREGKVAKKMGLNTEAKG